MTRTSVLFLVLLTGGCGSPDVCANDPTRCQDGGLGSCTGQCQPLPINTQYRVLLWSGPESATPPACPAIAHAYGSIGYLDAPPNTVTCSPCTCSPSGNLCSPSGTMSAHAATCPASGSGVPFDAPATWDGTCSSMDPVSAADSITVEPPTLDVQGQCMPSNTSVVEFTGGTTIALACSGLGTDPNANDVPGGCVDVNDICTYPNMAGFSVCTLSLGDAPCPTGWPSRRLFFQKDETCSCSCGNPVGESCFVNVTAYSDSSCSHALGSAMVTSNQSGACFNVAPGSALGSKSAMVSYEPGTCAPTLTKIQPSTLCCLP